MHSLHLKLKWSYWKSVLMILAANGFLDFRKNILTTELLIFMSTVNISLWLVLTCSLRCNLLKTFFRVFHSQLCSFFLPVFSSFSTSGVLNLFLSVDLKKAFEFLVIHLVRKFLSFEILQVCSQMFQLTDVYNWCLSVERTQ